MRHHLNIVAFVGLEGSGKSTVINYLTSKGFPKVEANDMIRQIEHLAEAGQHRVITDELTDLAAYQELKHTFPGQLYVVGITTNTKLRHMRLERDDKNPVNRHDAAIEDWSEAEKDAGPFALADFFIENNENEEALYKKVDALLVQLGLE